MRFVNKNVLLWVFAVFVAFVSAANVFTKNSNVQHVTHPPILVDALRQRYFSIEDALWHVISSGLEQSYVLQQIHSGHKTFLRDNFYEKNCYFSTFDPDQQVLFDAIKQINQSVQTTVEQYLYSSRRHFNERDSLTISGRNLNLTHYLDKLYEKTGNSDFYATIRNVSKKFFISNDWTKKFPFQQNRQ